MSLMVVNDATTHARRASHVGEIQCIDDEGAKEADFHFNPISKSTRWHTG